MTQTQPPSAHDRPLTHCYCFLRVLYRSCDICPARHARSTAADDLVHETQRVSHALLAHALAHARELLDAWAK